MQLNCSRSSPPDQLDDDPLNTRGILRDFTRPRGAIATADGVVLAKSVDSNDKYDFQRVYPQGDLYGQITGYFSFVYGAAGVEAQYNDELSGNTANQELRIAERPVRRTRTTRAT